MKYKITNYYKLKKDYEYPWRDNFITFFTDDIFTKDSRGYTVHTGVCMIGLDIPDEAFNYFEGDIELCLL